MGGPDLGRRRQVKYHRGPGVRGGGQRTGRARDVRHRQPVRTEHLKRGTPERRRLAHRDRERTELRDRPPRGPDGAFYASTTAYGLENDPNVPDVHLALGIGKIVRFTP